MTDRPPIRATALHALALLRRTLPQALTFGVAFRLIAIAILVPGIGVVARAAFALSGRTVVANADLLAFALSPIGLVATAVLVVLIAAMALAGQVGALAIACGAANGRRLTWTRALRLVVADVATLTRFGGVALGRLAWLVAPFLAVIAAAYLLLLGEHDINYYLTEQPGEFWIAVAIAGVVGTGLVVAVALRLVGWGFALPLALFDGRSPGDALRRSAELIRPRRAVALVVLLGAPIAALLLATVTSAVVFWLGDLVLEAVGAGRLRWTALTLGALAAVEAVIVFVTNVAATMCLAHAVAALYQTIAGEGGGSVPAPSADDGPLPAEVRWSLGGTRLLVGVVALAVASVSIGVGLASGLGTPDDVRCIAHRAGAVHGPENSLKALRAAIDAGADLAEIDVQLSSDEVIVVVHDRDLMKLAGQPWRIAETPFAQLQTADVGDGERIATLGDFLATAEGRIQLCVELKYYGWDERLAPRVIDALRDAGVLESCEVMSLEGHAVEQVREIAPEVRVGYLSAVALGDLSRLDVDFLAVSDSSANATLVAAAHRRGLEVYAWTLNDVDSMSDAIDRGIDGVITDDPPLLGEVLRERAELSGPERLLLRFGALYGR